MKAVHLIPITALTFLISCGSDQKPVEPENPLAELTEVFENLNDELSEIDAIQEIYTITSESAGDFVLGADIPVSTDAYSIAEESVSTDTEEGPYIETVYKVSEDNEQLLQILRKYDYETGEYYDLIGEMNITSDRFQTAEAIGVGSTITEFMAAYPDFKIWYTYISDMYVIETESLDVQFLLDESGYEADYPEIDSDMIEINRDDFNADTEIIMVRMFKI